MSLFDGMSDNILASVIPATYPGNKIKIIHSETGGSQNHTEKF